MNISVWRKALESAGFVLAYTEMVDLDLQNIATTRFALPHYQIQGRSES